MKRGGGLKRTKGLDRNSQLKPGKRGAMAERVIRRAEALYDQDSQERVGRRAMATASAFWEAARDQRVCAVTGKAGEFEAHHVVAKEFLKRLGKDPWDPRNALRLLPRIHEQHTNAFDADHIVRIRQLKDVNIEYAFEVLGAGAHFYLRRHYAGYDPRIELALANTENLPDEAS